MSEELTGQQALAVMGAMEEMESRNLRLIKKYTSLKFLVLSLVDIHKLLFFFFFEKKKFFPYNLGFEEIRN